MCVLSLKFSPQDLISAVEINFISGFFIPTLFCRGTSHSNMQKGFCTINAQMEVVILLLQFNTLFCFAIRWIVDVESEAVK